MLEENRFENILASMRVRKGWTQEDAAAHIGKGISRHTYSDLETGKLLPSAKHLKLIAAGFKLNQADTDALYHAAHHGSPKIHNLPFRRNPLFTGRESQFVQLDQLLKENYIVALTGLAGIGKTQIALEYAHRCYVEKVYQAVFWVSAADEESLQIGYATLAEKLDLPEQDEQELGKIVHAVKEWLERHTNWLLIMDNADNLYLARSFFPEVIEDNHGHILLTTRTQIIGNVAGEIIEVNKMEPAEGLRFLLRRSLPRSRRLQINDPLDVVTADTRNAASQVVKLLDGHPLALDQAGAFIEDGSSFSDYINRYHEKRSELLDERGSLDEENKGKYSEYPDTVLVTFGLCFDKARERHPITTDILRFCAFCQPDIIPDELFQHDESFKRDATEFKKGRTALLRYSLLKRNALDYTLSWDRLENTLSMHRLVQAVLIDAMSADPQRQWRERVVQALNSSFPGVQVHEIEHDFEARRQSGRLVSQVLACAAWTEDELAQTVIVASLLHKTCAYLHDKCRYSEAEPLLARVLSIYEQHIGVGHTITASELCSLAALYHEQDKVEQAEALYQQALTIVEKQLGTEHPDIAWIMHNLALLYMHQDKYDQAEPLLKQVLSFREEHLGAEHPDTLTSLHSLAYLYLEQDNYEQAENLYQKLLAIRERYLGHDHLETAISLYNLAVLYFCQYKDDQAVSFFLQVLKIWGQRPVTEYFYTNATVLALAALIDPTVHALAALLSWQGKHEQSEAYYHILDQQAQQFEDRQYGMNARPVEVVRTPPVGRYELCDHLICHMR